MANIYKEGAQTLHELLDHARSDDGATLLIPDLQRPFVWTPNQVSLLIDSLIRGWPFGTLLMWKVGHSAIQTIPHRQCWRVVDRTGNAEGSVIERKDPPASYQMILDGQQRVQSLLLALGGDAWGFRLDDRDWAQELQDRRPKGHQGKHQHWSRASLCFDLDLFLKEYSVANNLLSIQFRNVLCWAITDPAEGQSKLAKPETYEEPLPRTYALENKGRFIRLSRLWTWATTNPNIKEAQFQKILSEQLEAEAIPAEKIKNLLQPMGELMTTIRDVKLSKVTYLELAPFDKEVWTEDAYNDAIVNIFTRLNTAGRTLTREEITLAWLKVGWDSTKTNGKTAGECFQLLLQELEDRDLKLEMDDLVSGVSLIWAVCFNGGLPLANNDLLRGDIIRPMASDLARNWTAIQTSIIKGVDAANERGLEYGAGGHYASVNALALIWAWIFVARHWNSSHKLRELQQDDFDKKLLATLTSNLDRWLMCSQWAGRWAGASNTAVASYTKSLNGDWLAIEKATDPDLVHATLKTRLSTMVQELETDATNHINTVAAPSRTRVSIYRNILWIWHRLDSKRWEMSKVQLRVGRSKKTRADVDHSVAFALWEDKLTSGLPSGCADINEALPLINGLGNCSLLEKSFNISKSAKSFKSFLEQVHEFKEKKVALQDWTTALCLPTEMLDPQSVTADVISKAIEARDKMIRIELADFIKGSKSRVD